MNINDIATIINKIDTPAYIFDLNILNSCVNKIRKYLSENTSICYAMKANPFILKYMSTKVDRLEVCSPGEYDICIRENISPEKIVVSGVNKTEESIRKILKYSKGKGIYTIESDKHYEILSKCAIENNCILDVIIRLSSGNQFGVDKDTFENILNKISSDANINFVGIHYYSGTQKKIAKIEKELGKLDEFAGYLKEKYGFEKIELEYGPGLMVSYFDDLKEKNIKKDEEQLKDLNKLLQNVQNYDKTTLEFGRFISAKAGQYITRINDVKNIDDDGYIIVDGGIHQISYYGQLMGMKKPSMNLIDSKGKCINLLDSEQNVTCKQYKKWNICGSLCTSNDVIVRGVSIDNPKEGDIIVFGDVGAYSVTEGMSLFLSRELPQVLLYTEEENLVEVRKKTEINYLNTSNFV